MQPNCVEQRWYGGRWRRRARHALMVATLAGVPCLAVLGVGPGLLPVLGEDAWVGGMLSVNRPAAASAVGERQSTSPATREEIVVLSAWEFTKNDDVIHGVKDALDHVNHADQDAADAVLQNKPQDAIHHALDGAKELFNAYQSLLNAANKSGEVPFTGKLWVDAQSMYFAWQHMLTDANAGNLTGALADAQKAQMVANQAVIDASPFK